MSILSMRLSCRRAGLTLRMVKIEGILIDLSRTWCNELFPSNHDLVLQDPSSEKLVFEM